jgi:hypothetical protein
MSSDLIGHLITAVTTVVCALLMFGLPALAIVAIKFFKFKEREVALEMESRQKSEHQLGAIEERVQRLEDVLTSLDHDVRERLGIGRTTPLAAEGDLVQAPDVPAAKSLGSVRTKAR